MPGHLLHATVDVSHTPLLQVAAPVAVSVPVQVKEQVSPLRTGVAQSYWPLVMVPAGLLAQEPGGPVALSVRAIQLSVTYTWPCRR